MHRYMNHSLSLRTIYFSLTLELLGNLGNRSPAYLHVAYGSNPLKAELLSHLFQLRNREHLAGQLLQACRLFAQGSDALFVFCGLVRQLNELVYLHDVHERKDARKNSQSKPGYSVRRDGKDVCVHDNLSVSENYMVLSDSEWFI